MKFRWLVLVFLALFAIESTRVVLTDGNKAPTELDSAEVHNIAWNLAHGRGYAFDWSDPQWRKLWQDQDNDRAIDAILARRGSHPTMFRPPLMPFLVAGVLRVFPQRSFLAWRIVDAAIFAAAGSLLSDIAFVGGGAVGLGTILLILLFEPGRILYIPGWWTEGIAFALIGAIAWLTVRGERLRPAVFNVWGGVSMGLICLDRAMFTVILPLMCLALAASVSNSRTSLVKSALAMLSLALVLQAPWWIRNIRVSGQNLPLGTQGGFNLPDEYNDHAIGARGLWTNATGIRDAWMEHTPGRQPIVIPAGYSEQSFLKMWPYSRDERLAATVFAATSESLESEIAVANAGRDAAKEWVRANYGKVPLLMAWRVIMLTKWHRRFLAFSFCLGAFAYFRIRKLRRSLLCLMGLLAAYCAGIACTHIMLNRFLVPALPIVYVIAALGVASAMRGLQSTLRVSES